MTRAVKTLAARVTLIPHGVDERFAGSPREQRPISQYSADRPFRILYVSIIDVYKHQGQSAEAVAKLRQSGLPVVLDLVGSAYPPALARLKKTLDRVDPAGKFVRYAGAVPNGELHARYAEAEVYLFASSCENLPNILLEAMAAGLPIASSNREPMPEVLGDAGLYFDPESPHEIADVLRTLIEDVGLRAKLAQRAYEKAKQYSWKRCADETFAFISKNVRERRS